jgi:D-sedoheptulose 7-phosphate isomerase
LQWNQLDEVKKSQVTLLASINHFSEILSHSKITTHSHELIQMQQGIQAILKILIRCRDQNGTIFIAGNGGSAAIASHAVIDFLNMAKMKATAMLDTAVTTCISNDYGYEHVYSKQLERFIGDNDVLIAISSSGRSQNILNAVNIAKKSSAKVITFSGFLENNLLRQTGDYNLWLNSADYGQVEIGHAFILHYLTDRLKEYCIEEMV